MYISVGRPEIPVKIIQTKEIETCSEQKVIRDFFIINKTQNSSANVFLFKIFFEFFNSLEVFLTVAGKNNTCFLSRLKIVNFPVPGN